MDATVLALLPVMLWYCVSPNAYFSDRAADLKGLYDGYFFVLWSWDTGVANVLGTDGNAPTDPHWWPLATENAAALNAQGITENMIAVTFGSNEAWPSPELLRSDEWTAKMRSRFATLGRAAKNAGFKGVTLDIEYPYRRYKLDNPIYTYDGYTPGDLLAGAFRQGQAVVAGFLDEFPEAAVFVLPGGLRGYPVSEQFMLGMLDEMARRDAPGGLHLATEYSYSLLDPVTTAAIPRFENAEIGDLAPEATVRYWRERCSMAPGVWPIRMIEDNSAEYVRRPWSEELADIREQNPILRATTKRYLWTYGGAQMWLTHDPARDAQYRLGGPDFPEADTVVAAWHALLRDRTRYDRSEFADRRMVRLFRAVRGFDEGKRDPDGLCAAFGTPGRWWVLGLLGNPHLKPERTAHEALSHAISPRSPYWGRDGWVRWFPWANHYPPGVVDCNRAFGYMGTDSASAYFVTWVHADEPVEAWLNLGWGDGLSVQLGDSVVFNEVAVPPTKHRLRVHDRFQFERKVPVHLPKGTTRIVCAPMSFRGGFIFTFRITDADGFPLPGLRFGLGQRD